MWQETGVNQTLTIERGKPHLHHSAIWEPQEVAVEVSQSIQMESVDRYVGGDLFSQSLLHSLSLTLANLLSVSCVPHILVQLEGQSTIKS